jgi:hypothetical protein
MSLFERSTMVPYNVGSSEDAHGEISRHRKHKSHDRRRAIIPSEKTAADSETAVVPDEITSGIRMKSYYTCE